MIMFSFDKFRYVAILLIILLYGIVFSGVEMFYIGLIGIGLPLVGFFFIYKAVENYWKLNKIETIPLSKIRSISVGLVRIKGKILFDKPLISPLSKKKCINYKWDYLVNESKIDLDKTQSLVSRIKFYYTNTEMIATTVNKDFKTTNFYVEDETGKILIKGKDQEIIYKFDRNKDYYEKEFIKSKHNFHSPMDIFEKKDRKIEEINQEIINELLTLKSFKPITNNPSNIIKIKIREESIGEGEEIYVLGNVKLNKNGNKFISKEKDSPFKLSLNDEFNVINNLKHKIIIYSMIGIGALIFAVMLLTEVIVA